MGRWRTVICTTPLAMTIYRAIYTIMAICHFITDRCNRPLLARRLFGQDHPVLSCLSASGMYRQLRVEPIWLHQIWLYWLWELSAAGSMAARTARLHEEQDHPERGRTILPAYSILFHPPGRCKLGWAGRGLYSGARSLRQACA